METRFLTSSGGAPSVSRARSQEQLTGTVVAILAGRRRVRKSMVALCWLLGIMAGAVGGGAADAAGLDGGPGGKHTINGVCGPSALNEPFTRPPVNGLCVDGSHSAVAVGRDGAYGWKCLGEAGGSSASCQTAPPLRPQVFYVSASGGSDKYDGMAPSHVSERRGPFNTLAAARAALRKAGGGVVYVRGGTYYPGVDEVDSSGARAETVGFRLNSSRDAHSVYRAYCPSDCERPVLDGRGVVDIGVSIEEPYIRVEGFTLRNYHYTGVRLKAALGVVSGNTIENISSYYDNSGGIYAISAMNSKISNNLVRATAGPGVKMSAAGQPDQNVVIAFNRVVDVCQAISDCGGIYVMDRGHNSYSIGVYNNVAQNFSGVAETRGIYLDDETSWTTVENNIVYGAGTYGVTIHGGDHNVVKNNIVDATQLRYVFFYQDISDVGHPNHGMGGNVFTRNIIYSQGKPPETWLLETGLGSKSDEEVSWPLVVGNLYFAAAEKFRQTPWRKTKDRSFPSEEFRDLKPIVGDPGFKDPANGDYSMMTRFAADSIDFLAIDAGLVGPSAIFAKGAGQAGSSVRR